MDEWFELPAKFKFKEWAEESYGIFHGDKLLNVKLRFSSEAARRAEKVIRNRAEKGGWFGDTISEVCTKPWQFSCHNRNDPNRDKLLELKKDSTGYQQALSSVAQAVTSDDDPTNGACHYHTKAIVPHWVQGKTGQIIGNHLFYNNIK